LCTDKTIYEPFYAGFEEAVGVYKLELERSVLGKYNSPNFAKVVRDKKE